MMRAILTLEQSVSSQAHKSSLQRRKSMSGCLVASVVAWLSVFSASIDAFSVPTMRIRHPKTQCWSTKTNVEWEVYVDQSKASLDKGSGATLDAFVALAPPSVKVLPAILPRKTKGPLVRCVSRGSQPSIDVAGVDSVDKVYRVLTKHLKVSGVSNQVCDCLKWKYRGNSHLEANKVALAIDAYNKALAVGVAEQEGIILLMRATAYLKRAAEHKEKLKSIVEELVKMVPEQSTIDHAFAAGTNAALANSVFRRVMDDAANQKKHFRRTQYRHGLYQYALLQAAQDALRATQLLPAYATSWLRAGEILSELWKLKESTQYYERAMQLDPNLTASVSPVIERLRKRQELLDSARAYGWSEDTLRLALDVAG